MIIGVLVMCLIVYEASGKSTPCDSPKQWEGFVYKADKSKLVDTFMRTSYDEYNKRMRITEDEGKDNHITLLLYNEGQKYELNKNTGECTISSLDSETFKPYQIPQSARFAYDDSVVNSRTWEGEKDGEIYEITVNVPDCMPRHHLYYSNLTGLVSTNFFELTPGIKDPTIFDPPSKCL